MGEDGGIVASAAPQCTRGAIHLLAGLRERRHQQWVHRRGRDPGQQLDLSSATLLRADSFQARSKRVDCLPDDALFEMADLEGELGATWNHIHGPGVEPHQPDVGHGIGIRRQYQVPELGGSARGRPTRIVAQPERGRPRVVLRSDHLDPLAVDPDNARDYGQVHTICLHPRSLLDVQLDERLYRWQVLLRLAETVEVATCRRQDLPNGYALPVLPAAQPADVQLADQRQAPDEPN